MLTFPSKRKKNKSKNNKQHTTQPETNIFREKNNLKLPKNEAKQETTYKHTRTWWFCFHEGAPVASAVLFHWPSAAAAAAVLGVTKTDSATYRF